MACAGQGRFYKQERVKGFGKKTQQRLKETTIAIVGIGGLGCICAQTLARMGVHKLLLFDGDDVELSNLHRQVLYTEADIGKPKTHAAKAHLKDIDEDIQIDIFPKISKDSISNLARADIILECTDSLDARYLIDAYAKENSKPTVFAMAAGRSGFVYTFSPKDKTPQLKDILPEQAKGLDCDTIGILPTQLHLVTAVQLNACLDIIREVPIRKRLIHIDGQKPQITSIKV